MCSASGSKSQPGSGVPLATFANKSANFVAAPSATFLQKSGPSAALKVAGSHSSKATTCARLDELSSSFRSSALPRGEVISIRVNANPVNATIAPRTLSCFPLILVFLSHPLLRYISRYRRDPRLNLEGTLPRIVCLAIGGVNSKHGYFSNYLICREWARFRPRSSCTSKNLRIPLRCKFQQEKFRRAGFCPPMTAANPWLRNQNSTRREPWITRGPPPTTPAVVPTAVAVALPTVAVILPKFPLLWLAGGFARWG